VVATDTPVNRELLGDAGVYVPLSNPAMLAQRIVELLQAPERRAQIGSALRKRAEAHFAWPALCERLVDVYRHVLDHRPLAGPMP
jgi:glycosyltransferase involved in cell wall biosynthesis